MNSVSFPTHVVVILRRAVNAVSGLEITRKYIGAGKESGSGNGTQLDLDEGTRSSLAEEDKIQASYQTPRLPHQHHSLDHADESSSLSTTTSPLPSFHAPSSLSPTSPVSPSHDPNPDLLKDGVLRAGLEQPKWLPHTPAATPGETTVFDSSNPAGSSSPSTHSHSPHHPGLHSDSGLDTKSNMSWSLRGILFSFQQQSTPPSETFGSPKEGPVLPNTSNGSGKGGRWELPEFFREKKGGNKSLKGEQPPGEQGERAERKENDLSLNVDTDKAQNAWKRKTEERGMDAIHRLFLNPLLYDPVRTPRYPIVLCHGLYGFDSRGPSAFPSMRVHYWSNVLKILRGRVGAEVIVTSVPGTGSITERATRLDTQLQIHARGRGVNFLAHSMGGLDCRHLISHIRPREYVPLSLTSVCTPHRGSPFMDWCSANLGLGKLRQQQKEAEALRASATMRGVRYYEDDYDEEFPWPATSTASSTASTTSSSSSQSTSSSSGFSLSLSSLPSSFTTFLLSIVDSPAYANLTSAYLNDVFNPCTPDDPKVKYWSVASRMGREQVGIWHPFWFPKMILDGVEKSVRDGARKNWEEKVRARMAAGLDPHLDEVPLWADESEWGNDGLVMVQSAKWGEFLGVMEGCDHWEMRGARGIEFDIDLPALSAIGLGFASESTKSSAPQAAASTVADSDQAAGDGWGFGQLTRFIATWRKSDGDWSKAAAPTEAQTTREKEKEANLDSAVRSSTESLSAVFDWLIKESPSGIKKVFESENGDAVREVIAKEMKEAKDKDYDMSLKELSAKAVEASVGGSSSSSSPASSPSSMSSSTTAAKDKEKKTKSKPVNELERKEDLERFYISLARKMWDTGL